MARKGKLKKKLKAGKEERPVRFKKYEYLFLIVCEDTKTEPQYFEKYKSRIPKNTLYLKSVGTGRDPKGVVSQTIEERAKLKKEARKEVDCTWVVFDKDDADRNEATITNFKEAFAIAKKENFKIAYSNEVFELWLLLHFVPIDPATALDRQQIYELLRTAFQKIPAYKNYVYDHKKIDAKTLQIVFEHGDQKKAIERAEFLLKYHQETEPIKANPSTKVYLLVKDLLEWIRYYSYDPKSK